MFKFCVSFVKHCTEEGEIKGEEEKKKRMAISDSHYYRIWPYFVLVSSSSGVSESFVVKNKPPFGLENSFCQPAPRSCGRHGDGGVFPAVSNQERSYSTTDLVPALFFTLIDTSSAADAVNSDAPFLLSLNCTNDRGLM